MSNVHIFALPRSASKALNDALCAANENVLAFSNGSPLSEYFHAWPSYGYKFARNSAYPFEKQSMSFADAEYFNFNGVSFQYCYNYDTQGFETYKTLTRVCYDEQLLLHLKDELISAFEDSNKTVVIKSHLSAIKYGTIFANGSVWPLFEQTVAEVNAKLAMKRIGLYRRDLASWVMSRYLGSKSNIYYPSERQQQAIEQFKNEPVTLNLNNFIRYSQVLEDHFKYILEHTDMILAAEDLNDQTVWDQLSEFTDKPVTIGNVSEFSHGNYRDMIRNYDQVIHMTNQALVPRLMQFEECLQRK